MKINGKNYKDLLYHLIVLNCSPFFTQTDRENTLQNIRTTLDFLKSESVSSLKVNCLRNFVIINDLT